MYEIERKFLPNGDISDIISGKPSVLIEDYYLNDSTRIRHVGNDYILTRKYGIGITREETELNISGEMFNNLKCGTPLKKRRIFVKVKRNLFEVNIFDNIRLNGSNLIIIELPLDNINQVVTLPEWVGQEVTDDENYYGYNLFKRLIDGK